MKRTFSILLVALMMLTLVVPALAAETGKITINNAVVNETYTAYKMATLNSYDKVTGVYSYTVDPAWEEFFTTGEGSTIFSVTAEGNYLIQKSTTTSDIETVAKAALVYAQTNSIPATVSDTATSSILTFDNVALGYYLVDTSLGTLCSINTTDDEAVIVEKNSGPTIDKYVREDSDSDWGTNNDADLHQKVEFYSKIDCKNGATNYVVHDKMTGLDFHPDSVELYNGKKSESAPEIAADLYNVVYPVTCEKGCTFHVEFKQELCDTFTNATNIYLYYSAELNDSAVVAGAGNPNETWLTYGDKQESAHNETQTYTYEFEMVKVNPANAYVGGAEFTLWNTKDLGTGTAFNFIKVDEHTYRIADEGAADVVTTIKATDGKTLKITGLDGSTTYYLQEDVAPVGYNKMISRKDIVIGTTNLNTDSTVDISAAYVPSAGGIRVENRTGNELPETGGIGTTLFITFGTIAVIGTGILLVTKARVSKIEEE